MVSFELSAEQLEVKQWIHDFAEKRIRPAAAEWDEREETPWPLIQEAADIGLYSVDFLQQSFAGNDASGLLGPIAQEELFWGDAGIGLSIMGSSLAAAGIFASGTPDQVLQWLPECYGTPKDIKLGAFAVTEPNAGSDVRSLKTTARKDGDDWILNGTKVFITNIGRAGLYVVFARTGPEERAAGVSAFLVPADTPGLRVGQMFKKMGLNGSPTGELVLEDVLVPVANRLAAEGQGFTVAMRALDSGRIGISGQALGIGQAPVDEATTVLKGRRLGQLGSPHPAGSLRERADLPTWWGGGGA